MRKDNEYNSVCFCYGTMAALRTYPARVTYYLLLNTIDGECCPGSTVGTIANRMARHRYSYKNYNKISNLHRHMAKLGGVDSFYCEELFTVEQLNGTDDFAMEQLCIDIYGTGLNMLSVQSTDAIRKAGRRIINKRYLETDKGKATTERYRVERLQSITCDICGAYTSKVAIKCHKKTRKCIKAAARKDAKALVQCLFE